jgi:glycosyltransferase involved in cell wall biosynthesis
VSETGPLRLLFIGEGVLGHRTMAAQMEATLAANPAVEAKFATVPPPSRLARLLLRRWRRIGDADLYELRWRLRWSWQARRLLKRHIGAVDAAVLTTQASALLSRRPMRRLPCVLSIDATVRQFTALEYGGPRDRFSPLQDRLLARLERRAIAAAAGVVAWTEWTAEALRRDYGIDASRLATIHPGLDAEWWAQAAERRDAERQGPLRVLFVGNDVERKGLPLLIEAVSQPGLDAVLDVVSGDTVEETASVRVHRGVEARSEELRGLYAGADAFALPTKADATPWAVLEAMAAGLPVVATRVGAIAELLGDAGETIEPGGAEGLAGALRRLADPGLRRDLGERGLRRVRERYDSEAQAPRLVEFVSRVAGVPGEAAAPGRRIRRRTLIAAGAGVAGVAIAAPYLLLLPDDEFEQLVAAKLGIEPQLAGELLEHARDQYGDAEYEARAAAFAFAVRDPAAAVLPSSAREKAISGLVEPMLSTPAASLAYAVTGTDPGYPAACAGLVRSA